MSYKTEEKTDVLTLGQQMRQLPSVHDRIREMRPSSERPTRNIARSQVSENLLVAVNEFRSTFETTMPDDASFFPTVPSSLISYGLTSIPGFGRDWRMVGFGCTGGRPQITRWVHGEFIEGSETKCPTLAHRAHRGPFYKLLFNLSCPNPTSEAWYLL